MSEVKKLAGQTMWYGMSSVAAKMISSFQTPILTYFLGTATGQLEFASISILFSYFALLNVVFTYGMETAFFRFCALEKDNRKNIFNTAFASLLISTIIFCLALYIFRIPIEQYVELDGHTEYIALAIVILFFDTLQTLPFAKLRQENKPRKYAFIRVVSILINLVLVVFFVAFLPKLAQSYPNSFWSTLTDKFTVVSFVLLATIVQSVFSFVALFKEWKDFRLDFDKALWQKLFNYSSPMVLIGLAGVANEVIDRQLLVKLINNTSDYAQTVQGVYSANYKLSIVVTMFITAFRMAAEPFFFNKAQDKNAPELYAKVMKWFVITVCFAFLVTALFLSDIWILYLGKAYRSGIFIVPILLFANVLSGIYYNLSTWYKVTNRMRNGVIITAFGAIITFLGNYLFIPKFEMLASAWTTLVCYGSMVILCYVMGQKYFPVPYPIKRIFLYLVSIVVLYLAQNYLTAQFSGAQYVWLRLLSGFVLLITFGLIVLRFEKSELKAMPIIGKYLK